MLVLNLGVPPTEFDYVRHDAKGNPVETEHHTPMSFLEKYGDKQLLTNYVMLMNDPSREYYKCYEIEDVYKRQGRCGGVPWPVRISRYWSPARRSAWRRACRTSGLP